MLMLTSSLTLSVNGPYERLQRNGGAQECDTGFSYVPSVNPSWISAFTTRKVNEPWSLIFILKSTDSIVILCSFNSCWGMKKYLTKIKI